MTGCGYAPRAREDSMRPRRLLGASVQPLNFAVRRFGGNLVVTLGPTLARLLLAAPFVFQLAMLALQLRAFAQHRHVSFLLLSIATVCGLLYLSVQVWFLWWHPDQSMQGSWFWVTTVALLFQMVLGLWGTASLFRSYGKLASAMPLQVSADRSV